MVGDTRKEVLMDEQEREKRNFCARVVDWARNSGLPLTVVVSTVRWLFSKQSQPSKVRAELFQEDNRSLVGWDVKLFINQFAKVDELASVVWELSKLLETEELVKVDFAAEASCLWSKLREKPNSECDRCKGTRMKVETHRTGRRVATWSLSDNVFLRLTRRDKDGAENAMPKAFFAARLLSS
ncbi:MAG: hypothetical protein IT291_09540 [Deltaproteobacteria bacterium]|nr:hypothetical protein [Deltaproteobacteria bacterium]